MLDPPPQKQLRHMHLFKEKRSEKKGESDIYSLHLKNNEDILNTKLIPVATKVTKVVM